MDIQGFYSVWIDKSIGGLKLAKVQCKKDEVNHCGKEALQMYNIWEKSGEEYFLFLAGNRIGETFMPICSS